MALGQTPQFNRTAIPDGIKGMVRAMSQTLALSFDGQDYALLKALAARVVGHCRARDTECEIQSIFSFTKEGDGGALKGEILVDGPVYAFSHERQWPHGTFRVVLPGGVVRVYEKSSGKLVQVVPANASTRIRLPAAPWNGLHYLHETAKLDTYQTVARSLEIGGGDCDDHSVMIVAIAKILGYPVAFRVASTNGRTWTHVYAVIGLPKKDPKVWVAMDSTDPFVGRAGWDPATRYRLRDHATGETRSMPYIDFRV